MWLPFLFFQESWAMRNPGAGTGNNRYFEKQPQTPRDSRDPSEGRLALEKSSCGLFPKTKKQKCVLFGIIKMVPGTET